MATPSGPLESWGDPEVGPVVEVQAPLAPGASDGRLVGNFRLDRPLIAHVLATTDLEQSIVRDGQLLAASLATRRDTPGPLVAADPAAPAELTLGGLRYVGFVTPLRDTAGGEFATLEVLVPLTPLRAAQQQATVVIITARCCWPSRSPRCSRGCWPAASPSRSQSGHKTPAPSYVTAL